MTKVQTSVGHTLKIDAHGDITSGDNTNGSSYASFSSPGATFHVPGSGIASYSYDGLRLHDGHYVVIGYLEQERDSSNQPTGKTIGYASKLRSGDGLNMYFDMGFANPFRMVFTGGILTDAYYI